MSTSTFTSTLWRSIAACRGEDINLFFPPKETLARGTVHAFSICDRCPVRKACEDYANTNRIKDGIWGGSSRWPVKRGRRKTITKTTN